MEMVLQVGVPGHPKTKGSLTPINSGRLTGRVVLRDTPASKRWRQLVAYAVRNAMANRQRLSGPDPLVGPIEGPVFITVVYRLPVTEAKLIEQGSGDVDKLDRNLLDALQDAGLYHNDAQVVRCWSDKVSDLKDPGMDFTVWV
jgi:Holliday junction resolvase RusA-like endonuclease